MSTRCPDRSSLIRRLTLAAGATCVLWSAATGGGAWEGREYFRSHEDRLGHSCEQTRLDAFGAVVHEHAADLRYNESTGADSRVYPPDRLADHKRMVLEIDIPDMNTPRFDAVQRLTIAPISKPLSTLTLNAVELDIQTVEMNGRSVPFSYDGERLSLSFDPPLPPDRDATIVTTYTCTSPVDGLFWLTEENGLEGRPGQIHTQGQPETNRYWFPCHDFPNERLSTELVVTVPEGYLVSSNGELRSERQTRGEHTFHWALEKPHPNYLVSLIVGKFDVVDVARPGDLVSMPVYVPPGAADTVMRTYKNTGPMLDLYSRLFDEPYPWPRYAQLVVWNFGAGGMENTSATTMYDTAYFDEIAMEDADLDGLISHELAHQWFGDYLTCNSWEHIWLNEGFATYLESLWFEERDGYDAGYLYDCWLNMRGAARRDRVPARDPLARPGMVSNLYESPGDVFGKASNPYPKGASTLQMLRAKLGDDAFFGALRAYVDEHKLGTVRTHHLQEHFEKTSGLDLQHFFEQWTVRPGTPQVTTDIKWDERSKSLNITVEQTQPVSAEVPAFAFDLPVKIHDGREWREVVIPVTQTRHQTSVALPSDPKMVCVDPDLHVLMTPTVKQTRARFVAQLREGPTVPSRLDAAVMLEDHPGRDTVEALLASMGDTNEHYAVRSRAAETLGRLNKSVELMAALQRGVENPRVRRAAVDALVGTGEKDALPLLEELAADDRSYAVRSAAIDGLGRLGGDAQIPVVMSLIDTPSQHDQIRRAALGALADLDAKEGLAAAMRYTGPGYLQRTRASALSAIAALSEHDEEAAYDAVAPYIYDSVERVRNTAAFALMGVEDERGVDLLRRAASNHPHPDFRASASSWADRLAGRLSGDDVEALQETVGELRNQVRELERRLEKQ
ncbi:MAG: M1 family aminopeptidase [Phycisphaerales bacterium]